MNNRVVRRAETGIVVGAEYGAEAHEISAAATGFPPVVRSTVVFFSMFGFGFGPFFVFLGNIEFPCTDTQ